MQYCIAWTRLLLNNYVYIIFLAALNKGFPLPNLDEVHLTNPGIVIMPVTFYLFSYFSFFSIDCS